MKNYKVLISFFLLFTASFSLLSCKTETKDYNGLIILAAAGQCDVTAPTGLQSIGSLGQIRLTWTASASPGVTGYNVYRSTDGSSFTKITLTPVAAPPYDDAIASPGGDGIIYYYRVTSVGCKESDYSAITKNVHGTRLATSNPTGFTTIAGNSPYVAEGTVAVDGGDLTVDTNTKLYVLDNAAIDIQDCTDTTHGHFVIKGLLRVLADATSHATFTAHKYGGGSLGALEGFKLWFDDAVSYNGSDGSGTLIQNTLISNLIVNNDEPLRFANCAPKFYNSKIAATSNSSAAEFYMYTGVIFQNCRIDNLCPGIFASLQSTSFLFDHNILRPGSANYSFDFANFVSPGITAGQIASNDIDGSVQVDLANVTGSTNPPLGNNYWGGGTGNPPVPTIRQQGTTPVTLVCDFSPALSSAPSGAGPSW